MAQKVQVLLLCDLEEGNAEAHETIQFRVGSSSYEIDVCAGHGQQIRGALEPYIAHARKAAPVTAGGHRRRRRTVPDRDQSASIRSWAKDHGIQISERGRIPESVIKEYEHAQ